MACAGGWSATVKWCSTTEAVEAEAVEPGSAAPLTCPPLWESARAHRDLEQVRPKDWVKLEQASPVPWWHQA